MSQSHFYEPAAGHRLAHDPFKAIVAPRPVGWVSTVDVAGRPNLAPYSYFNAVCDAPPMLAFSSQGRKDTLLNVESTGEFVWSLATRRLAEAMNATSAAAPHGDDEFALAGLEAAPSRLVRPPRVAASPASMECRLLQVVRLHGLDGTDTRHHLVIGEVVGVHIDSACLADGAFDTARARPIARCGGWGDYAEVSELFQMRRPQAPGRSRP